MLAEVRLWGQVVGAVSLAPGETSAELGFDPRFLRQGLEVAPLTMAHVDFQATGAHSHEQALLVIRRLGLGMAAVGEQCRRMAFNILARNQDDHAKNIAFPMDRRGNWSLAPAFDVIFAWQPAGRWTALRQMTMNSKREGFTEQGFLPSKAPCIVARSPPSGAAGHWRFVGRWCRRCRAGRDSQSKRRWERLGATG